MFFVIVLIIICLTIGVTVYICLVAGAKSDDAMNKIANQSSLICLDCGKVFLMEQWEERCCCPDPLCNSYNVEICKEKNDEKENV